MQIVTTTPIALLFFVAILWLGPRRGILLLFTAMPLGAAAAFNSSSLGSVMMTDLALFALWLSLLLRHDGLGRALATLRPGLPGFPLLLLVIVALIGAMFLPRIFIGQTEVFVLTQSPNSAAYALRLLQPSGSNFSQAIRLFMVASAFPVLAAILGRCGDVTLVVRCLVVATVMNLVLSLGDLLSHPLGVPEAMDFFRTANYEILDHQVFMGLRRLIGGFPEPSAFSYYTIGLYGFWLAYWFNAPGSKWRAVALLLVTMVLLRSTSSAGIASFVIHTGLFLLWQLRNMAREHRSMPVYVFLTVLIPLMIGGFVLAYSSVPLISDAANSLLLDKMESSSGEERSSWTAQSFRNFLDSYGVGIGIGTSRSSSWIAANLGSFGVLGGLLQIWFLLSFFQFGRRQRNLDTEINRLSGALKSGCAAVLIQSCMITPFPNLGVPFYAMGGLATGLLLFQARLSVRHGQVRHSRGGAGTRARGRGASVPG